MIVGNNPDFFIQYDVVMDNGFSRLGPLNFWINGKAYPGEGHLITLETEVFMIVDNFDLALKHKFKQSNLPIEKIDFLKEEVESTNLLYWSSCELWDNGLSMLCEIVGDTIRIFYSLHGSPYEVIEVPVSYYQGMRDELFEFILSYKRPVE